MKKINLEQKYAEALKYQAAGQVEKLGELVKSLYKAGVDTDDLSVFGALLESTLMKSLSNSRSSSK